MFGRRRHVAAVAAAPVPQLSEAQILEVVHEKIAELIGERGEWTVSRRSQDDTDTIFHAVLANSVSLNIATALFEAKRRIEAGELEVVSADTSEPQHLATDSPAAAADANIPESVTAEFGGETGEPAAFGWEPAPITVWTDLRKPVTGEIPAIIQHRTAA